MSEKHPFPEPTASGVIDRDYIERLIDHVGRERVFAKARELGWAGDQPPIWVWNQICIDMLAQRPPLVATGTIH